MSHPATPRRSRGQLASLACLYEVTAPKPGNVHRGADFEDMTFFDFVTSAIAIAPAFEAADSQPVGKTVFDAISATRTAVNKNTNLGIVLLLAPLAAIPDGVTTQNGIKNVLSSLTTEDARLVYDSIRLASPGGMGQADEHDVNDASATPPPDLLVAMQAAEDRDLIAHQYTHGFSTVLESIVPDLIESIESMSLSDAIVYAHVRQMARTPDSLISRKLGDELAQESSDRAAQALVAGQPGSDSYLQAVADLDFWLRSDGHRRNPGTTADLIAAALFVGLREGMM